MQNVDVDQPGGMPTVVLLMPRPRRDTVFAPATLAHLRGFARLLIPDGDTSALGAQLPHLLPHADACLTGWGAPAFPPHLLAQAPRLKIIAHAAGSIKALIPQEAFVQGIVVSHAAAIIADAVAECTLLLMLTGLRRLHLFDQAMKEHRSPRDVSQVYVGHHRRVGGLRGCGAPGDQPIAPVRGDHPGV